MSRLGIIDTGIRAFQAWRYGESWERGIWDLYRYCSYGLRRGGLLHAAITIERVRLMTMQADGLHQ